MSRISLGAKVLLLLAALPLAWFLVPPISGFLFASGDAWYDGVPFEASAQLRSIEARLANGETDTMDRYFPEGRFFAHTFYGFTLVNLALTAPQDEAFRRHALAELERLVPLTEEFAGEPPFTGNLNLVPRGGIIPAGQTNLLRAGYVLLGGTDDRITRSFRKESAVLFAALSASEVGSLESYPGAIWPVDNVCALESLRLHDDLYGTDYREAGRRWERWMASRLDPESGLMIAQIDRQGRTMDGPRGCAMSWSLALMPGFAPDLTRTQYDRYRRSWFVRAPGMTGIREWPPGRKRKMNADTGPVVFGIGAAASGFGIAAAKANGDRENLTRMLRGLELLGLPTWGFHGKSYFFGQVLLADEIALWGKTDPSVGSAVKTSGGTDQGGDRRDGPRRKTGNTHRDPAMSEEPWKTLTRSGTETGNRTAELPAWKMLAPGVEYAALAVSGADGPLHVVRIDPGRARFTFGLASQNEGKARTAAAWCKGLGLAVAINAGMYRGDHRTNVSYLLFFD